MADKKQLTLKQAEAEMQKHQGTYRDYVKAQLEKKDAKTKKEQDAAQKKMDSLRPGYTAYRNAYRAFTAQGGSKRGKAKPKPAEKKQPAKKGSRKPVTKKQIAPEKIKENEAAGLPLTNGAEEVSES